MSAYPSLPLFTDAFLADTGHLSAQETGAYLLLLMVAWRNEGCRLPDMDEDLAAWARVDMRTWKRLKPRIMERFWTLADGFWTQKRLTKERDIVSKRAAVARENGARGGRPKSLENDETENPAGSSRVTQKKAPNPIYTLEEINSSKDGDAVADPMGEDLNRRLFSDRVLTFVVERSTAKDAKAARALLGKWKRLAKDDTQALLDTLSKARNQNIADLSAWMPKALAARDEPRPTFWRPGMPVAAAQGKPDVFGRTPDHPLYGSSMAV
jgi:uncharacterized protein YdaU (DUF1376 family)